MRSSLWTMRVLWIVTPHHRNSVVVMALVAGFGVWTVVTLPRDIGAPYVLLMFCQLFAASSGFRPAADAGHYDAILVRGTGRLRLALSHWALSATPGAIAWVVVSAAEVSWLGPGQAVGITLPSLAAVFLVSTVPWTASLATTRFFGGAVWVLGMGALATTTWGVGWVREVLDPASATGVVESSLMVARFVTVPFMYLVPPAFHSAASTPVLGGTCVLAGLALWSGATWITRRDYLGGS